MTATERAFCILALFFIGVFFPWWFSLPLALFLALKQTAYELLFFGFFLDRLYGTAPSVLLGAALPFPEASYSFLLAFSVLFFVSVIVKRSLIFYAA